MADDLGWGEVGLYNSTSEHGRIATPNLDQFGREGTIFTDAYAGYTVSSVKCGQAALFPGSTQLERIVSWAKLLLLDAFTCWVS